MHLSHSDSNLPHGFVLQTPGTRRLGGNIAAAIWAVGAFAQSSYMLLFASVTPVAVGVIVACLVMVGVCLALPWEQIPSAWLFRTEWLGVGVIVVSAINFQQSASLIFLFPLAVLVAYQSMGRWSVLVTQAGVLFVIFVVVSLMVGGPGESERLVLTVPPMVISALVVGVLGHRFATAAFERKRSRGTISSLLFAMQARDGYTVAHSAETLELVVGVANNLDVDSEDRAFFADVALLHDIGKIGISNEILNKPDALSDAEWLLMKEHPAIGERILSGVIGFERVAHAIRHCHERWDGMGYPDGLIGEQIPLASRVVLVCDAFHAMTSDRPYREAMSEDAARAELLRNVGTQFDPAIVTAMIVTLDLRRAKEEAALSELLAAGSAELSEQPQQAVAS